MAPGGIEAPCKSAGFPLRGPHRGASPHRTLGVRGEQCGVVDLGLVAQDVRALDAKPGDPLAGPVGGVKPAAIIDGPGRVLDRRLLGVSDSVSIATMRAVAIATLGGFLVFAMSAVAALTPQEMSRALAAENPNVLGTAYNRATVKSARCREEGASGFRCITTYDTGGLATEEVWLWVKPRRAGGLCVSPSGPSLVPPACLARGRRARGSTRDAYTAFRRKVTVSPSKKGECIGYGSGFYACQVRDSAGLHRATVTFTPAPVVRVLTR
jgi:hypothetical protein